MTACKTQTWALLWTTRYMQCAEETGIKGTVPTELCGDIKDTVPNSVYYGSERVKLLSVKGHQTRSKVR